MRGYTYNQARESGLDPRDYDWQNLPEGTWIGRLDFKAWGNASGGNLVCYFTELDTNKKFRLSAFRLRPGPNRYTPKDGGIDFSADDIEGQTYRLTTGRNRNGNMAWLSAETIDT